MINWGGCVLSASMATTTSSSSSPWIPCSKQVVMAAPKPWFCSWLKSASSGFYSSLELLSGFLSDCRKEQRETRIARHRKRRQEFTQGDKKDLKEKVQAMIIEGISDKEIADKLDQKLSLVFAIRRGWL